MSTIYQALDRSRKEIRILTSVGHVDDYYDCHLETISLNDNEEYRTISWCWGDQDRETQITANGEKLIVRGRADQLLRWIHESGHRRVWLDAVCINQFDLDERSHQVTLMREIYSKATETLAVLELNVDDQLSKAAHESIQIILHQAREETDDYRTFDSTVNSPHGDANHTELPLPPSLNWPSICTFFASQWFTRVWCIQEITLSRSATCTFGSLSLPWKDVQRASCWLQYRSYWKYIHRNPGTTGIDNCSLLAQDQGKLGQKDTWYHIMTMSRSFKSTDPRDKVYGLLGLRHTHEKSLPIVPDYTKKVPEVYIDVTRGIIHEHDSLHMILTAQSLDPLPGAYEGDFPSWVPRFDYWFVRAGNSYRSVNMDPEFGAANRLKAKVYETEREILAVDGVFVDSVAAISNVLTERLLNDLEDFEEEVRYIWRMAEFAKEYRAIPRGLSFRQVMMDTLTMDCLRAERGLPKEALMREFEGFLGYLKLDGAAEDTDAFDAFKRSIWLWCVNRVFYITETGYIGMGPRATKVGDALTILFGSRVPCMLRLKDDGMCTYVGDTYVKGIMEGELIRELQSQGALESETMRFDIA